MVDESNSGTAAGVSMLSSGQHHSFHQTPFHVAGGNMTLTRITNLNVTTSSLTVNTVNDSLDGKQETGGFTPAPVPAFSRTSEDGQMGR